MNLFDVILINPIINVLVFLYSALSVAHIPFALGFAIILLTVSIRLVVWPLTSTQLKSSKKMAELKPHLDSIKSKHGADKVRHQQEVSKLYKEHGVNPLAGCLPLLLQIPIFIALYQVLLKFVNLNSTQLLENINTRIYLPALRLSDIPSTSFFGLSLSAKPDQWQQIGFLILAIPLATGVLQYIQSKMLVPEAKPGLVKAKDTKKEGKAGLEDSMGQMQSQMTLIMPAMIAFFSYGFPVGLSLYWNTFTIIGIVQQYKIMGAGSLAKYLPKNLQK
ncbi:MAG: YidC/Oxa1 family membrane protein insertase [Candidatus Magasanikbacteria bacterium]|nr:YidC/Oxa1 family membrane protein insertase [Candidatus Magasanikbacteria bacterium]